AAGAAVCPEARIPRSITTALHELRRHPGGKSDRVGALRRNTARISMSTMSTLEDPDTAAGTANSVPATTPATAVTAPPGCKLVNPFVQFRQRNPSGGLFSGPLIKMDHNTGALLRERGDNKTVKPRTRFTVNPLEMIETWSK